jgi:exodeoxyribonuclease V alpha subunit
MRMLDEAGRLGHTAMDQDLARVIKKRHSFVYDPRDVNALVNSGDVTLMKNVNGTGVISKTEVASREAVIASAVLGRHGSTRQPIGGPGATVAADLSASQRLAWGRFQGAGTLILTGRPGTGKTYLLSKIIESLHSDKYEVMCAAPTGKAASVLCMKLGGRSVRTIHSMLGLRPDGKPLHNRHNKLQADFVVIDECSMVDSELMSYLLDAIDPGTGLILCGDPNQLQSVGAGTPFNDIIMHGNLPCVELVEPQRNAADSGIIQLAYAIADGKFPTSKLPNVHMYNISPVIAADKAIDWYSGDYLSKTFGKESDKEALILSAFRQKKFDVGTENINKTIAHKCNTDRGKFKYAPGDRVMFTSNDYVNGWVNGEIGTVMSIGRDDRGGEVEVEVETDIGSKYNFPYADSTIEWAHALTVHKAQGSEAKFVALLFGERTSSMYTRQLVYTAVTRASQELFVIGNIEDFKNAVLRVERRTTMLGTMFKNESIREKLLDMRVEANKKAWSYINSVNGDGGPF